MRRVLKALRRGRLILKFNLPPSNSVSTVTVTNFGGIDLWNSPENVDKNRSPLCVNMIRDKSGSVRKRMGYERISQECFDGRINGACYFGGMHYIHSGKRLFSVSDEGEKNLIYEGLEDEKSVFIPTSDNLYIISKGGIYFVGVEGECKTLESVAYVPTVIVSKAPAGGGTLYEDYNLLSDTWREQFLADGESTVYKLEKNNVSAVISVEIRDENGDFQILEKDKYSVSASDGTVTFKTAPEKYSVVGMDNVVITAKKDEGNKEMLYGCTVGVVYGSSGKNDRLFIGGNNNHKGMDFFSESGDFSYFPHMNYSKLSDENISGYSVANGSLYTHFEADFSIGKSRIIKRDGAESKDGREIFVITDEFYAPSLASSFTAIPLNGEALYLSKKGVYGITVSDVTSEKVCQLRSAYLGDAFEKLGEEELENAHAVVFGDFFFVVAGEKAFILDGSHKSYFEGTPLCSFQYECYYWENIPARVIWTDGERLYFGSADGKVFRFFTDRSMSGSYTDDGEKVVCFFDTAQITGRAFFKKKTFVSASAKIGAHLNTGIKIYAKTDGVWHERPVYDSMGRGKYLDFSLVNFESMSFSSNRSEVTLCGKVRIRNTDSVSFRLMNDEAEPFVLIAFGTEYVQKNNYIR